MVANRHVCVRYLFLDHLRSVIR